MSEIGNNLQKCALINDSGVVIKILWVDKDLPLDEYHIIVDDKNNVSPVKIGDTYSNGEFYRDTKSRSQKSLTEISKDINSSDISIEILNGLNKYSDIEDEGIKQRVELILNSYVDLSIITEDKYDELISQ